MDQIRRVTDRWSEHLASFGQPDIKLLESAQRERGLLIHGRPLCAVARPHFVAEGELSRHRHVVEVLSKSLVKARDHVVANRKREAEHLGRFYDWIGDIVHLEPADTDHGAITRLDAFRSAAGLSFIEMNADCPGGAGHNDGLSTVFQNLETFRAVGSEFNLQPLLLQPAVGKALIEAWRDWGGKHKPKLAVVGWFKRLGFTEESIVHDAEHLLGSGIASVAAVEPGALEFDGQRLVANGTEIDIVYRFMLMREVLAARDELKPLLSALRQNAVCMVNSFHAELMGHKALFALLTDPEIDLDLDATEREIVQAHVPWGRLLRECSTPDPDGRKVDLIEYVLANRENLVLKPAHEAKGDGIELGWKHDGTSWEAAVQSALASDYILQQRVPTERVDYPAAEPGMPMRAMYEDTDPLVTRGHMAGFLTRLSESEIVNVSRRGSVVPSFVVKH